MNRTIRLAALLAAAVSLPTAAGAQTPPTLAELRQRAAVVKPIAAELKWQRIPWMTDLAAAHRAAQQERRPLLLWVTGDDPLERC